MAKYAEKVLSVEVDVDGEPCKVEYRPNAMTPRLEIAMAENESGDDTYIDLFCQVVESIDATGPVYDPDDLDEDGNPSEIVPEGELIPVDPEIIALLPSRFLTVVMATIRKDMTETNDPKGSPARNSRKNSRGGSFGPRR